MQKLLLLGWCLLLASLGHGQVAPHVSAPPRLSGQWQGPLKVPGGTLTVIITLVPLSNGTYYAALDVPQQRISRMPVQAELKADKLVLRIEQAGSSFEGKVQPGGNKFSGIWQQVGLKAPLVLTRQAAPPVAQQSPQSMRLTPPYRESEVTFYNAGAKIKLAGTLTVPSGEGPFPAVALLSDLGPQNRDSELQGYHLFGILADYLTRRGIAVLRFDDRGTGQSGGDYASATTADFLTDAQAAMSFLRAQPLIASKQVGLLGHGEGGNVSLLAAAEPLQAPNFVVALAAYGQPGLMVLRRQQGEILRLIGADGAQVRAAQGLFSQVIEAVRATPSPLAARTKIISLLRSSNSGLDQSMATARAVQLTSPWSRYFFDFNPTARLALVHCPVLLLNGTADLQVAAGRNLALLRKGLRRSHQPVQVRRLRGVNHWFQSDPTQWPIVAGERKATFVPLGLTYLRDWLLERARQDKAVLPVMAHQP